MNNTVNIRAKWEKRTERTDEREGTMKSGQRAK